MPTATLAVIRGGKSARPSPKKAPQWPDLTARWRPSARPDADADADDRDKDVIPLLEGWARLIERQASR